MISSWILTRFLIFLMTCVLIPNVVARNCDSSDELGYFDVFSVSGTVGVDSDTQFIMTDTDFISPCCGVVTSWKIYATTTGTLVFQVWRPNNTGTDAELVGENSVNISNTNEFTYNVPTNDQIEIHENDVIGWYSGNDEIVEFAFGFHENIFNFIEDISQPNVGDTVILSTQVPFRTFAIYATLDGQATPTLTNLDNTIYEYTSSIDTVTSLFTVTSSSPSATFALDSITPSNHFTISSSTGEVRATTTSVSGTTYVLNISVSQTCTNTSTGTLTIVLTDTTPVWSNLDATISISENSVSAVTASYTVIATSAAENVSVSYSLQSITPSSSPHFIVDAITGDVIATTLNVNESSYSIVIRASDPHGNYVDGTLTLNIVNNAPEIKSLPDAIEVSETAVDETLLHIVNVTDIDEDVTTCEMMSLPSGPFTTKYMTINGIFTTCVYLQANPNLNYSQTNTYILSVTCTDGSASDTGSLYVYITANNVPQITNLPNTTSIISTTPSSSLIFKVVATDLENDVTYFSLSCLVSSPCPFLIYSDGSILLTSPLVSTTTNAYELDISVRDDYSSSGVHRLTVFITDLNTKPELNNLPANIQIPENTSVGTTLFEVSVYDEDGDSPHTFTAFFSPATSSALFQLNSTSGVIVLATPLNYLTQENNYTVTLQVSDDQILSDARTLTIEVVDVNQAPLLYQTNYQVEVSEGPAGTEAPDPAFNVYDADSDQLTYSWGGGNDTSKFSINTTNGIVSFSTAFDTDDTTVETLYIWLVVIADPEGLSTTATLTLSIIDANDNVPSLTSTSYAAVISSSAQLGTSVLNVQSTDGDVTEEYRELQYSVQSTSLFRIDHSGLIFVYDDLSSSADTIETFSVRVQNPGVSSYDSADISISIEKDDDDDDFFDNSANIAWVTLLCVFGPPFLACVAYLCFICYQRWVPSSIQPKGHVTQVAPSDTKMATPKPYTSSKSREASVITRGTVVTPREVNLVNKPWEGWRAGDWQAF